MALPLVTRVARDASLARLRGLLGQDATLMWWDVFTGAQAEVAAISAMIRETRPLPPGWQIESTAHPDEATITAVQDLNAATGIAPPPAYYMRGDTPPV